MERIKKCFCLVKFYIFRVCLDPPGYLLCSVSHNSPYYNFWTHVAFVHTGLMIPNTVFLVVKFHPLAKKNKKGWIQPYFLNINHCGRKKEVPIQLLCIEVIKLFLADWLCTFAVTALQKIEASNKLPAFILCEKGKPFVRNY